MKIRNLFLSFIFLCGMLLSSCNGDSSDNSATTSASSSTDATSTSIAKTYTIRIDSSLSSIQFYVNNQPLSCVNNICKLTTNQSQIVISDKDGVFVAAALLNPKARTLVNATSTGHYLFDQILAKSSNDKKQLLRQISHVFNLSGNKNFLQAYQYLGLYYTQLYQSNQTISFYDNIQNVITNNSQIQVSKPKIIKQAKTDITEDVVTDFIVDTEYYLDDCLIVSPLISLFASGTDGYEQEELTAIQDDIDIINQNMIELQSSIDELEGEFEAFQTEYETNISSQAENDIYALMNSIDGYYNSYINVISDTGSNNLNDYLTTTSAFKTMHNLLDATTMSNIATYMKEIADQNGSDNTEYLYKLLTSEMRYPSFQVPYAEGSGMLDLVSEQNDFDNTEVNIILTIAKTQQEAYILELAAADIDYNYASDPKNTEGSIPIDEELNLESSATYADAESSLSAIFTTRNNIVNTLTNTYYQNMNNSAWPDGSYKTSCRTYLDQDESTTAAYYTGESMGLYCTSDDSAIESSTPTSNLVYSSINLDSCGASDIYTKNGILQCVSRVAYVTNNTTSKASSLYRCVANESMMFTNASGASSCTAIDIESSAGQDSSGNASWLYAHDVAVAGDYLFVLSETSGGSSWIQSCPINADESLGTCRDVYNIKTYAGKDIMAVTLNGNSYLYVNNGASVFEMQIDISDGSLDTNNIHEIYNKGSANFFQFFSFDPISNKLYVEAYDGDFRNLYYCPISITNGELSEGENCSSSQSYYAVNYYPAYLIFYNSELYFSYNSPSVVGYYSSYAYYNEDKNCVQPSTIYSSTSGGAGLQLAEYGDNTYMYIMNKNNDIQVCDLTSSPTSGTSCVATNSGLTTTYRMAIYGKN